MVDAHRAFVTDTIARRHRREKRTIADRDPPRRCIVCGITEHETTLVIIRVKHPSYTAIGRGCATHAGTA